MDTKFDNISTNDEKIIYILKILSETAKSKERQIELEKIMNKLILKKNKDSVILQKNS